MNRLMRITLADGAQVLVEVDERDVGVARAGRAGNVIESTMSSLEAGLAPVCETAAAAMRAFRARLPAPEEIEISFGIRLTAEAGAVIARSGVEAHLDVTVRWATREAPGKQVETSPDILNSPLASSD